MWCTKTNDISLPFSLLTLNLFAGPDSTSNLHSLLYLKSTLNIALPFPQSHPFCICPLSLYYWRTRPNLPADISLLPSRPRRPLSTLLPSVPLLSHLRLHVRSRFPPSPVFLLSKSVPVPSGLSAFFYPRLPVSTPRPFRPLCPAALPSALLSDRDCTTPPAARLHDAAAAHRREGGRRRGDDGRRAGAQDADQAGLVRHPVPAYPGPHPGKVRTPAPPRRRTLQSLTGPQASPSVGLTVRSTPVATVGCQSQSKHNS